MGDHESYQIFAPKNENLLEKIRPIADLFYRHIKMELNSHIDL